jgi:hypothetical protein
MIMETDFPAAKRIGLSSANDLHAYLVHSGGILGAGEIIREDAIEQLKIANCSAGAACLRSRTN